MRAPGLRLLLIIVTFVLALKAEAPDEQLDLEQLQALDELFAATNGPSWNVATGWSTGAPVCKRFGVRCDENHRVERLELADNALRGVLPSRLSQLRHLHTLSLGSNALHGELPSELVQLQQLRLLALTNNRLGPSFPEWLVEMPALMHVALALNNFAGTVPSAVLEHFQPPRMLDTSFQRLKAAEPSIREIADRYGVRVFEQSQLQVLRSSVPIADGATQRHSTVCQARESDRLLAVKHSESDLARELSTLVKLKHPNIVELVGILETQYDVCSPIEDDEDDGIDSSEEARASIFQKRFSYMVTEWIEGGNLEVALSSSAGIQALPFLTRVSLALDVARALAYAHSQEPPILHRDIRAANVLLSNAMAHAKLADFSLSVSSSGAQGAIVGYPPYMAPEMMVTRKALAESDVYSFGILLSELLSGKLAYSEAEHKHLLESPQRLMQAVVQRGLRPTLPSKRELPAGLWPLRKLIMRCLDQEPSSRPTMKTVVNRLARLVDTTKQPPPPKSEVEELTNTAIE